MTTPPPVLLVLAWDDDDPAVHRVAATAALPARPTLPLVRALAAEQAVLALLPQLPADGDAPADAPAPGPDSRLVGLSSFMPATLAAGPGRPENAPQTPGAPAGVAANLLRPAVQLRPSPAQRAAAGQVPAAPYAGRAESPAAELFPPPSGSGAAGAPGAAPAAPEPSAAAPTELLAPVDAPPQPAAAPLFDQPEDEIGTGEAAGLAAGGPELDLPPAPTGPVQATLTQGLAALHRAPAAASTAASATVSPAFGLSDDLHYRVIQYARFATYLADGDGEDFGAVYAPDWPTWLAAIEIGYRRRRPLVLHLGLLAAESAAPAERGWLLELERYALRRAHTVLVTSEALRAQVLKHYALSPNRVRVLAADDADGIRAVLAEIGATA